MRILLLNGPNLNLLGTRSPEIYGSTTLPELESMCRSWSEQLGHHLEAYQSNHEGALIDAVHGARGVFDGIVFNSGAYSHTSYALRDAIEAVDVPTVEVHISNIRSREEWRRTSVIEPVVSYQIFGRGVDGYRWAIHRLHYDRLSPATTHGHDHPERVGDLRVPEGTGPHPVVVLIHGGFWREVWTRDTIDGLAADLHRRGFATWNIEYRRIPPTGAWRTTIGDVVDGIDALTELAERFPLDLERVTLLGHSAGAQLAVMASQQSALRPDRLVLLAGVLDFSLIPSDHDALPAFLGEELESHADQVNPVQNLPTGIPSLAAHGTADDMVDPAMSASYVDAATAAGDQTVLLSLDGADHFDVIDPDSNHWKEVAETFA